MVIRNPRGMKIKCPECGSERVRSTLSVRNIMTWTGMIVGANTVRIYEKRCADCGHKFEVFRK